MRAPSASISQHKLRRFNAWLRLALAAFVGWCVFWTGCGGAISRRMLDRVARIAHMVVALSVFRAMPRLARTRNRHGRLNRIRRRTIIGARWRRLTRDPGKGAGAWARRVFAILAFVRDAETHIARQLRRLRRGLTRLRVILPRAESCALVLNETPAVCAADTS